MTALPDFTKTLNILLVEDDELTRKKLIKSLGKYFNVVCEVSNGLEGWTSYKDALNTKNAFDLIISDINMPKLDGIELLKKIRENNKSIPFIFITGRCESEKILEAIEYNVNGYILKPLDLDLITIKLKEVSTEIYYKKVYDKQKRENEDYFSLLNKEAIVTKTNTEGQIIFVNDTFCQVSGFKREELIGQPHNIVRHPDVPKDVFRNIWATIQEGKIWEGRFKSRAKDGSSFFLSTKIIPIYDDFSENIVEYMAIRFVITDEETRKREFNKKVIESLSKYKKYISELKQEKNALLLSLQAVENEMVFLDEKNKQNSKKVQRLLTQVESYERNSLEFDKVTLMSKQDKQKQFDAMYKSYQRTNSMNDSLLLKIEQLKKINSEKVEELARYEKLDIDNKKRIDDLKDLVTHFQKEKEKMEKSELYDEEQSVNKPVFS